MKLTTSFIMPKGYRRVFRLEGKKVKAEIIFTAPDKLEWNDFSKERSDRQEESWTMDWMLECRNAVEKDIVRYKR